MTLNLATEDALRDLNMPYLNAALDLWTEATKERLGNSLEVVVGNRRKHPALSGYRGINTQVTLSTMEKTSYLAIWYDPYDLKYTDMVAEMGRTPELIEIIGPMLEADIDLGDAYEPSQNLERLDWDMLLRKILLWVLRARGFKKMANRDNRFAELESLINTECWTPALNSLLISMNYDFGPSLKELVADTLSGMENMEEPTRRADRALNALRLWNLLAACDPDDGAPLSSLVADKFPRINIIMEELDKLAKKYDLNNAEDVLKFTKEVIRAYRLPGEWEASDEFTGYLQTLAG